MRAVALLGGLAAAAALAGCPAARPTPAPPAPPAAPPTPAHPAEALALEPLVGGWRWVHGGREDGAYRLERERWRLGPLAADPATGEPVVTGRYRRDVVVVAVDGRAFRCNQQAAYRQTAFFDLRATVEDGEVWVEETGYEVVPSPCDPGERRLGRYRAERLGPALRLAWDGGTQRLLPAGERIDDAELAPPPPREGPARIAGAWHWELRGRDAGHDVRDEDEAWELAVGADGAVGGSYVRAVTVHSGDGTVLPCAGATRYRFVDRVVVRGRLDGDALWLEEVAIDPGAHPCLAPAPERRLDTARGVVVGDYLVLTWRGARRQVLHRPAPPRAPDAP